jgi:glycosyltransferase involved in cell wall biosynthesis
VQLKKINVIILGVSYFDGMASSTRVRNLLEPLLTNNSISASNLIYQKDSKGLTQKEGLLSKVHYKVIGFRKSNPLSVISFTCHVIKFLKKNRLSRHRNILYNYDQPDLRNILLILYAKLIGFKVVLDIIENNRFSTNFPRFLTKIRVKSSIFLIEFAHLYADIVFAISDHLVAEMKKNTKGKIPVYLIPITVDLKYFPIKSYKIPEKFKIFYGGSFGEKDGLHNLIKALESVSLKFDNVNLILTGRGADCDMNLLQHLIDNSTIKEKIIFKGFLPSNEYYELMNECDIFCMTRVNSKFANAGFPFKLGEFLATGKSVIATTVGDIPKYLKNKFNAILITPSSSRELDESIQFLLNNPSYIPSLGREGRKTAENHFDSEKISAKIFSIFKDFNYPEEYLNNSNKNY